jgi:hypothetical protein
LDDEGGKGYVTEQSIGSSSADFRGKIDGNQYPLRFVPASQEPGQKIEMIH